MWLTLNSEVNDCIRHPYVRDTDMCLVFLLKDLLWTTFYIDWDKELLTICGYTEIGWQIACQVCNIQGRLLMCIVLEKNTSKGSMLCSEAGWRSLDFKVDLKRMV